MNYRLTIYPAIDIGGSYTSYKFETKEELNAAASSCANLLIFMQDKLRIMPDYSNVFTKEEKIGLDWEEIYD